MPRLAIHAIGHHHPESVLDNQLFDSLDIGSSAQWISEVTGIEERRSVLTKDQVRLLRSKDTTVEELRRQGAFATIASMAEPAWRMAQSRFGSDPPTPELLLCGTSVPDFDIPANACTIGARLHLPGAAFDVNSACSSFVTDLHVARSFMLSGLHRSAAIFNVERYTTRVDYSDRTSCVLWGDGATATIVGEIADRPNRGGLEIVDTLLVSDSARFESVVIPEGGVFSQNGKVVQKFAVTKTVEVTRQILERNRLRTEDIQWFIGHQANLRMLTSVTTMLGLPLEKHLYNVDKRGNQGGAGAPAVLSANFERYQPGDFIVLSVVGAGLTWGAVLLRAF